MFCIKQKDLHNETEGIAAIIHQPPLSKYTLCLSGLFHLAPDNLFHKSDVKKHQSWRKSGRGALIKDNYIEKSGFAVDMKCHWTRQSELPGRWAGSLPRQTIFHVQAVWAKKARVASRTESSIKRIPFITADVIQIFSHP